jgi:hypothetical protein
MTSLRGAPAWITCATSPGATDLDDSAAVSAGDGAGGASRSGTGHQTLDHRQLRDVGLVDPGDLHRQFNASVKSSMSCAIEAMRRHAATRQKAGWRDRRR